jgi:hypothetical protein
MQFPAADHFTGDWELRTGTLLAADLEDVDLLAGSIRV